MRVVIDRDEQVSLSLSTVRCGPEGEGGSASQGEARSLLLLIEREGK
jgi:hypothetical protein